MLPALATLRWRTVLAESEGIHALSIVVGGPATADN
jgi:hypothetical protein